MNNRPAGYCNCSFNLIYAKLRKPTFTATCENCHQEHDWNCEEFSFDDPEEILIANKVLCDACDYKLKPKGEFKLYKLN